MKKNLLLVLLVVIGITAYSQSPTRFIQLRPAYPVAIGETTVDSLVYSNNGLYMYDILQDSLPKYEIGHIFAQTVRYTEEGHGFYVKADSLHSNQVTYSYQTDTLSRGPIEFNSTTGRFIYYPLASDYQTFVVRFIAASPTDTVWEDVEFELMPQVRPEQFAFQSLGVMPDGEDYTLIASADTTMFFNNENRTVYSYSISGKDIVFDNNVQNKVWGLSGREDLYELNLFAEKLIIRSALKFPQTNVTIYAKEVLFEDGNNETASVNVSPTPIATMTNGHGLDGADAGNISLFVKEFHGNPAKRFILNGAKGQSTNRSDTTGHNNNNGTPGNGGNGGTVISNIDIQDYCDFTRGSCGLKFNVIANGPHEAGAIIGAGTMGQPGHFELQNNPFAFLHPYYITAVMRYAKDAYINNYMDHVSQLCSEYHEEIEAYMNSLTWDSCGIEESTELQDAQMEMEQILFNIEQDLDFFGNSVGWVPLLSFEVMLANFDAEIDRAIPTLYMSYWLNRVDQTLRNMVIYSYQMAIQTEQDIQEKQNNINSWLAQIPGLQYQFQEVLDKIDSLTYRMNVLAERLMSKARHNVKKRHRFSKAIGICKTLINCIPVYGQAVSTAINVASNIAYVINETGINDYGFVTDFNPVSYTSMVNQLDAVLGSWSWGQVDSNPNYFKNKYDSLKLATAPLVSNIQNLQRELSKGSTPANEVEQEFEKLKASSAEWHSLEAELILNNSMKTSLYNKITDLVGDIRKNTSEISSDVITLDALRRDAFIGNSKRDLNAMQYLEKMEQRAKYRLLKYHYYLRKAYEYRMLKPYEGEFNLVDMFERFETLGLALDSIVDPNAYTSLKSVFREVVSDMVEQVIDEYSTNYPEQSAPLTIVIPREQLDVLNANESFTLNFYEMGIFSPDEENVRIVDLGIQYIETHVVGNVGYSGYMDLNMTHQGISRFRKDGQIYWFDHMSRSTTNPHTWGLRYDAVSNITTNIQPSFASASLLYSILNSSTNMMLFSRPSAWGDITLSKKVHSSGGADIVIDSLVLRLQYDFTHRPTNIRNIDITTNEGLLPYIACSEADRNGRSNGNGNLNRSYNASNQTVTFSAIEKYGNWYFVNWTNRADVEVSNTMDLTVSRSTDQFYRANYERRVPILSVPDTIEVYYGGGIQTVHVANIGSGDLEMDWYVSDSLSTWVHLNSVAEGIDDGIFSFMFDANESGAYRIDSLEIFAPETDIMSKMIYIVQVDSTVYNVSADVVPEGAGTVYGTGFYEPGEIATLIATPVDECSFVSWELNGQVVSTDSIYSFVVNSNVQLTANFTCDEMISVTAEVSPENSGQVFGTGLYHPNDVVTLHAIPFDGYAFANWTYSDMLLSDNQDYTFVAVSDVHYVAHFQEEVGIDMYDKDMLIIYPNPAKESVNIEGVDIRSITIYSSVGKEIYHQTLNGENMITIDLCNIPNGLYMIVIKRGNDLVYKKLVKSK